MAAKNPILGRLHDRLGFLWAMTVFLLGYLLLLLGVARFYLIPAYAAMQQAAPEQRGQLQAWSALLLAVLLAVLIIGLLLTFRLRRYFMRSTASPTRYPDAWSESARRTKSD